jgi:hypothetical protein
MWRSRSAAESHSGVTSWGYRGIDITALITNHIQRQSPATRLHYQDSQVGLTDQL